MAYHRSGGGSTSFQKRQPFAESQIDVLEWYVPYQSCVRYFLDHAQYSGAVQAVAAYINIQLPFQKPRSPILSSKSPAGSPPPGTGVGASSPRAGGAGSGAGGGGGSGGGPVPPEQRAAAAVGKMPLGPPTAMTQPLLQPLACVTLVPYIRRLVATGYDFPGVLHSFFGDDWHAGVGPLRETERRNYMFAAKSDTWLKVKASYDLGEDQTVPWLSTLRDVDEGEIVAAEQRWSEWLAMQDWMIGPRAVDVGGVRIKREED